MLQKKLAFVFVTSKLFQASLICADKARSLPIEWQNLPVTNTLAYFLQSIKDNGKYFLEC
jgi:hypothetical protein